MATKQCTDECLRQSQTSNDRNQQSGVHWLARATETAEIVPRANKIRSAPRRGDSLMLTNAIDQPRTYCSYSALGPLHKSHLTCSKVYCNTTAAACGPARLGTPPSSLDDVTLEWNKPKAEDKGPEFEHASARTACVIEAPICLPAIVVATACILDSAIVCPSSSTARSSAAMILVCGV